MSFYVPAENAQKGHVSVRFGFGILRTGLNACRAKNLVRVSEGALSVDYQSGGCKYTITFSLNFLANRSEKLSSH